MDNKHIVTGSLIKCMLGGTASGVRTISSGAEIIYDSIDNPVCEISLYVLSGTVEVEIFSVDDTVDGGHKPATYKNCVKCIDAGDWLLADTINSLKLMNLEVRVRGLGGRKGAEAIKFNFQGFLDEAIKLNDGELLREILTRTARSTADLLASDYHAQYRPARNSDYITENHSVTLMLSEYLQCAIVASVKGGWAPFIMPTTELRVRTKLPNKSIASYRGILEDAGYIKFTGLTTSMIHLKKSLKLLEHKPYGSRKSAKNLAGIHSRVFFQK